MHVLVAPDKFAGTLTAPMAAQAIAEGWQLRAPLDELVRCPMSDGGPGFVDVLHAALGGELVLGAVSGPLGEQTPASVLLHEDTAYVECAAACGLHLLPPDVRDPERASSFGVGQLLELAAHPGVRRIVVGLGGSATNDGGAGLLAALGARADVDLGAGPAGLAGIGALDLRPAVERLAGIELVAATDVDNPLLGMFGATNVYGPQKGLSDERKPVVDSWLDGFVVAALGPSPAQRRLADQPGAGAAGGLGFALLALGATCQSGIALVAGSVGLPGLAARSDLVITGEGAYDFSSRSGKVVHGVARIAGEALRPCIVLAGQVLVGAREMRAMGVESAYSIVDAVGSAAALGDPAASLRSLSERVARTWSY
ncbi:MAG: glycerate kinase family protein [Nocardioidaceae bacterium]